MLPYPSSAGVSKYGASTSRKLCGSRGSYGSMLDALPDEMFRALAISSNEMRASSSIMAFTHATNSSLHFLLFFTLPLLLKMLDFPDWKCFAHQKAVVLEGADDGLADRSSDRISVAVCLRMMRTLI